MKRNWFWPVFLIASAVVLITSQLGLFSYHLGIWSLLLTIVLVAALISSLRYLSMPGVVFAVAFLAIIYAKPLGITALVPWTILGAAVLLSIGLSMLIHPRYHYQYHNRHHHHHDDYAETTGTISDNQVNLDLTFGSGIRYVHSDAFEAGNLNVSMGSAKIYFDDVSLQTNTATINLNVSLGSLELYLPKTWQLQNNLDANLGSVNVNGVPTTAGPVVILNGRVSLGELTINYL
ncbi:LiaF transmembrane domain-containing protein [Lactiplantibacillus herbarum]|uniref:LiaF transmembrane domain-containing protein n=1 Tax=Lactiplantibacillus herbarum TaxID=1670446 RepID=UPI00064EE23D|nr:membrane protein [Lactiplantibacillus herbarum]